MKTDRQTKKPYESVLFFTNGELIGDGFIKFPLISCFRDFFPKAKICWLTGKTPTVYAGAMSDIVKPYIDEVIENTGLGNSFQIFPNKIFKNRKFDLIVNTEKTLSSILTLKQINHNYFLSSAYNYFFSDFKPNSQYKKPDLLVERLSDLLSLATDIKPILKNNLDIPQKWLDIAQDLLKDFLDKKIVLLAVGAGGKFKCWSLENYINLAKKLKDMGIEPLFILGPQEQGWDIIIKKHLEWARFPLQETSEKHVYLTIALCKFAKVIVANDGGVGHIIASSNTPTISLWGPTDPKKSRPNGDNVHIIYSRNFGGNDMSFIDVGHVLEQIQKIII